MPEASKVRWSQLKVGVVAIVAFIILFVLVFLLTSSKGGIFSKNAPLRTYMDDASGISDGSVVRLNGYTIGYLDHLTLTGSRDPNRAVEFDMRVQPQFLAKIPVDSVVAISAANLLGDKFLNITRGQDSKTVQPNAELPGSHGQDIPELLASMSNALGSFQIIVKRVDNLLADVEQGKGNIGLLLKDNQLYTRANGIVSEGQKLLADVRNGGGTISKLIYDPGLYEDMRSPIKRIDAILADLQNGQGTAGKLLRDPALVDEVNKTIEQIRTLVAELNSGKGTAGKLLKDDQLSKQLDLLANKLNGTLDRINSGQGTVGQFLVNQQLYDSLNGATREFQSLAKDMRANPKKFLTIQLKLF